MRIRSILGLLSEAWLAIGAVHIAPGSTSHCGMRTEHGNRVHRRHLPAGFLVLLAFLTVALSACTPEPSADALKGPAKSVSAAVQATILAVDLRNTDRTTAAAGTTVADDMLGEVESAIDEVEGLAVATDDDQILRDDMVATFSTVSRSILHARDAFTAPRGESDLSQPRQLPVVLGELKAATEQLDALMTRAGIQ